MKESRSIKVMAPSLPLAAEILPWLEKIDANGQYTNFGPLCRQFEQELARLSGAPYAVTVSSCTLGLELAISALDLPAGATVLVPSLTFPATATAVVRSGLTPAFGDVDEKVLCLTPCIARQVAAAHPVDAVAPVALHGHVQDAAAWDAFSAETGVPVLIDGAGVAGYQTVGSTTAVVFSLHATKPLGIGEGGFLATRCSTMSGRVRTASNFGFESGELRYPGTNAKLSEYHAAVGLAALDRWPERRARRQALYEAYAGMLARPKLRSSLSIATCSSASPNLCIKLHDGVDERTINFLADRGIETRRWYWPPLHRHPAFAHCAHAGSLETTERLADRLLGLPFHLSLELEDIEKVADALAAMR